MNVARKQKKLNKYDKDFQVGACVVNDKGEIIGEGTNRMPKDYKFTWLKGKRLENKHYYVCHAELNAIAEANKKGKSVKDCTLYTTLYPCCECAKIIVQFGMKEVVYESNEKRFKDPFIAGKLIFDTVQFKCREFAPDQDEVPEKKMRKN